MPESLMDTANSDIPASVTGDAADVHASLLVAAEQAELETLDDLLSNRGRYRLREMADVMKDSGALRIKDHRTIQGNNPDTFKGEYAKDWILRNEKLANSASDAMKVSQAMLDLNIFHSVTNNTVFDCKNLYAFREPGNVGGLGMLKNRIVAIEDYNIAQTKANKEAQAEAAAKTVQLDWRVSVTERRLEAVEGILRRALVVQQVVLATLLIVLVLVYAPIWANVAVFMISLVAVLLVVVLLESRSILSDSLHLKVDYKRIANCIMGIAPDDEEDGLSSGRLEAEDTQVQAFPMLLTTFRGRVSDAVSALVDSWEHVLGILRFGGDQAPGFQISGVDTGAASCADQKSSKRRISGVSLSGASRLMGRASGRLTKLLGQEDRCNGLRRQSAPVHSSADIDAPVWPGVVSSAAEQGITAAQPQHTAPMTQHTSMPGPPSHSDFDNWWNGDMLVRQPYGEVRLVRPFSTRGRVRVNYADCHPFDGPLFAGKILVWIKGLPLGEDCPDVFKKVRRRTWVVVQGRFKERVPVSRVYTGQAFKQPLEVVPKHVMRAAMLLLQSFTRVISSSSIIQDRGAPIVMYPLVLGAQVINVAMPGNEPDMQDLGLSDDVRLLVPQLTGSAPASESERRAYFGKDANRQATFFDPSHVYTFHVRQHVVDVANYRLPTSLCTINLLSYLKGQPIRFMAVDVESQRHLWNLEAWHRQLLNKVSTQDVIEGSSTHGTSLSTDSLSEVRSNASPTVHPNAVRRADVSFVSDTPLPLGGDHSDDASDDLSGTASVAHGQGIAPSNVLSNSCSFTGDTAVGRQSSEEPHYSAVNITVPTGIERANSSTVPTPKPFLEQAYAVTPSSEGQQLQSRLMCSWRGSAPAQFNGQAASTMFSTAPPGGMVSASEDVEQSVASSEKAADPVHSGACPPRAHPCGVGMTELHHLNPVELAQDASPLYPRSLPNTLAWTPSSQASSSGARADVSQESNTATPAANSDAARTQSVHSRQRRKTKKLRNPFRRTAKQEAPG